MTTETEKPPASRLQLLLAFAAVYVVWGSTYLAIRFAIETMPPFTMAGIRFLTAGALVYGWTRLVGGASRPALVHWRTAAAVGGLLLLVGNGAVAWAEQRIPSGIAALLVAGSPLWMVLLDALRPGGHRPTRGVVAGLVLGLVGIVALVGPSALGGGGGVDLLGAGAVLLGSFSWALGSIYSRAAPQPSSTVQSVGMQMLVAGAMLLALGVGVGERVAWAEVSSRSALAVAYLVVFGSIVAYTAYAWLLQHTTAAKAATYAYVNPAVAVFLGWALAGEELSARMFVATAVIVAAVWLITTARSKADPA